MNNTSGCSYKEFMACNPKEYDGKGGVIVYTCWIEKMELVQDMSGCGENQKVKYTTGSLIGKALTWWNSQAGNRGPTTIQSVILKAWNAKNRLKVGHGSEPPIARNPTAACGSILILVGMPLQKQHA
ncbi:hypothetical protein Tco_0699528 [Tanacetum coccineum]